MRNHTKRSNNDNNNRNGTHPIETQTLNQFILRQIAPDSVLDLYSLTPPKTYPDYPLYSCEGFWVKGWTARSLHPSFDFKVLMWVPSAEAG